MSNDNHLREMRAETLDAMERNERWFKILLAFCGLCEVVGFTAIFWLMDWSDPTHRLVFACTIVIWINLALWVYTSSVRNRVGEQRILRSIELLDELTDKEQER